MKTKQDRLKEFEGYGYTVLGETENFETIIVKRFESRVVMIMAVHEDYTSQLRIHDDVIDNLVSFLN